MSRRIRAALNSADLAGFGELLAPDVRWGAPESQDADCRSREEVVEWWSRRRQAGARARVTEVVPGAGALLVGLKVTGTPEAERDGGAAERWQVLRVEAGQVVDIRGFDNRHAAALRAGVAD
ncbi:MAG: nuclear transport factor 2 family protein [Candidatus Dormiibacterota bacterium]